LSVHLEDCSRFRRLDFLNDQASVNKHEITWLYVGSQCAVDRRTLATVLFDLSTIALYPDHAGGQNQAHRG
jgi:hypothetical protein